MPAAAQRRRQFKKALKRENKEDNGEEKRTQPVKKEAAVRAEDLISKPRKFVNKQRTLILASRGVTSEQRHLMKDLRTLLPHAKKESKFDGERHEYVHINELCSAKKCQNAIFFEACHRGKELFMYALKSPIGPTIKFRVTNICTMEELKLTGNCLQWSRPLLHFDAGFDSAAQPQFKLIKEIFTQIFAAPQGHPKVKPFFDHIFAFYLADGKIWFRNFQIVDRVTGSGDKVSLAEIGPRFILDPVRILSGAFNGELLFNNDFYVTKKHVQQVKQFQMAEMLRQKQLRRTQQKDLMATFNKDSVKAVWFEK